MFAPTLFEIPRKVLRTAKDLFMSVSDDPDEILRAISVIHNKSKPFDCDPTCSSMVFYKNFPKPLWCFDLNPQAPGVQQADCRDLPLADGIVHSLIFDPPFVMNGESTKAKGDKTGKIGQRFTSFKNYDELKALYIPAIHEFFRVLASKGLFVIKCQDSVTSGKNYHTSYDVITWAEAAGFVWIDTLILERRKVMIDQREQVQRHARKVHSYFLVFRKP